MKKSKINKLFCISLPTILLMLSIFPNIALSQTNIEDSTVPVKEGETYFWTCNYCYPPTKGYGIGSYIRITIDQIYQGSYLNISSALIIKYSYEQYIKNEDWMIHFQPIIAYNFTLRYFHIANFFFMVPIPINFTLVCESFNLFYNNEIWSFSGNLITKESILSDFRVVSKFNSNGLMVSQESYEAGLKCLAWGLASMPQISFGFYFILPSLGIIIIIIMKRCTILRFKKQT